MGAINWTRVLLGGLLAGTIMNVGEASVHAGLLGADASALLARYQVPEPTSAAPIASLVLMTYVLGIAAVWLYAAIRPRYGSGASTAMVAGLAVWVIAHLWSGVYIGMGLSGLIPAKLAFVPVITGLIEAPLATIAGAWIYKE